MSIYFSVFLDSSSANACERPAIHPWVVTEHQKSLAAEGKYAPRVLSRWQPNLWDGILTASASQAAVLNPMTFKSLSVKSADCLGSSPTVHTSLPHYTSSTVWEEVKKQMILGEWSDPQFQRSNYGEIFWKCNTLILGVGSLIFPLEGWTLMGF